MSAEGTNRPAKRDFIVINDDESKKEQPAEKIVKEEVETASLPGVVQLKQELMKSNAKFKRMCEMAGELKARVEFLENIIDTKQGIIGHSNGEESVDELRKKVVKLTKQLEEEKKGRMEDRERYEQPQQDAIVKQPSPDEKPGLTGGPINILQMCDSNMSLSIPFDTAREVLHSLYAKCNLESLVKSCETIKSETINCEVCEKEMIGVTKMFHHFFSKEHTQKMLARSVLEAAVKYWKEKLEQSTPTVPIDNTCHNPNDNLHSTNILHSCGSKTPESISYFGARRALLQHISNCDMESLLALCANEFFDCQDCEEKNLDANQVLVHYLSKEHAEKMTGRNVLQAAISYWKENLNQAESKVTIHNVCHPINIFQLCRSNAPNSITIDCARDLLKPALMFLRYRISSYVKNTVLARMYCEVCKTHVVIPGKLKHLFSEGHIMKAKAVGADSISLIAVNYWARLLKDAAEFKEGKRMNKRETKAATAAANKAAAEAHMGVVQRDPAAVAASDEAKKEIVKVEHS